MYDIRTHISIYDIFQRQINRQGQRKRKMTDKCVIQKLSNIPLTVPGLTDIMPIIENILT